MKCYCCEEELAYGELYAVNSRGEVHCDNCLKDMDTREIVEAFGGEFRYCDEVEYYDKAVDELIDLAYEKELERRLGV